MQFSSPGPGACPWSASLPPQDIPVDQFLRNGIPAVPVALVPSNDGFIRMKNPKVIQAELRAVTSHFHSITEVRQFGRGGILCFSSDQLCVQDLLKCSSFATNPVSAFIPPHLACVKGIVRGVDVNLTPSEVLEMFAMTGAISVYRCARLVEKQKTPTESVIVTFAGVNLPSEIKAWPLIYRVEPLSPRPLQCTKCWRYGHTIKGCRSELRCRVCGDNHETNYCKAKEEKCCLCNEQHCADNPDCSAKAREMQILEIIGRRRCSRREALAEIQTRTQGYASVAARHLSEINGSISLNIAEAIEKALEKAMERLTSNLCDSLSQILANQMTRIFGTAGESGLVSQHVESSRPIADGESETAPSSYQPAGASAIGVHSQNEEFETAPSYSPSTAPSAVDIQSVSEDKAAYTIDSDDMDLDPRSLKRSRSPVSRKTNSPKQTKNKKYLKEKESLSKRDFLKESILEKAIAEAALSKP